MVRRVVPLFVKKYIKYRMKQKSLWKRSITGDHSYFYFKKSIRKALQTKYWRLILGALSKILLFRRLDFYVGK